MVDGGKGALLGLFYKSINLIQSHWDTVRGLGSWGQGSGEMEEGLAARLWAELLREAGRRG